MGHVDVKLYRLAPATLCDLQNSFRQTLQLDLRYTSGITQFWLIGIYKFLIFLIYSILTFFRFLNLRINISRMRNNSLDRLFKNREINNYREEMDILKYFKEKWCFSNRGIRKFE